MPEWDYYGKLGTLKHLLGEVWGEWPWYLIAIIVGSVVGGLTLLYGIFRFVMLVLQVTSESARYEKHRS